jgi:hypothetical protein
MTIVAQTTSRFGGRLNCGHNCRRGDLIFKLDIGDRGGTTTGGNGLGVWCCAQCAADAEQ